jgi:hypothetical protein
MFRAAVNHFKMLSLPLSSHTRDCWFGRYADKTIVKIPLHNEKILDKPEVIVEKDYITIIFNKVDELE